MKTALFAITIIAALACGLRISAADTPPTTAPAGQVLLTITDGKTGKPIDDADIVFVAGDGTRTETKTDAEGKATISGYDGKPGTIAIAHPNYPAFTQANIMLKDKMGAKLTAAPNVGSMVISSGKTGKIPGLAGHVGPINVVDSAGHKLRTAWEYYPPPPQGRSSWRMLAVGAWVPVTDDNKAIFKIMIVALLGETLIVSYETPPQPAVKK